jgi:hypothetical protein
MGFVLTVHGPCTAAGDDATQRQKIHQQAEKTKLIWVFSHFIINFVGHIINFIEDNNNRI